MRHSRQPAPADPSREDLIGYITRMLARMPVESLRLVYQFALHL